MVAPRRRPPRVRFFVSLATVMVGTAAFAIVFREGLDLVFERVYGAEHVVDAFRSLPFALRILLPALGGVVAGAASAMAVRRNAGPGVGEVMEAVVIGQRRVSLVATSWKAFGSWAAIVTGGSIGREGPLIQFGGALASAVGTRLGVSDLRQRALISAGTAAGFAAAYNTPIAAVLFVAEVIVGVQALGIILPTMLASAIAATITRAVVGAGPLYGSHPFGLESQWELVLYVVVGAMAGVVGVAFMRVLRLAESGFRRLTVPRPVRAGVGGLIVGVIACAVPEVTGNGYEPIVEFLTKGTTLAFVGVFLVAKLVATSASVGSGSPGGVFTPSLALGACLGVGVAGIVDLVAPAAVIGEPGAYALVGMAAVVAATTHAPLMAAVLVFELTGDYAIVLPLLVASCSATAVARWIEPLSIYMQELRPSGQVWEVTVEGRRPLGE